MPVKAACAILGTELGTAAGAFTGGNAVLLFGELVVLGELVDETTVFDCTLSDNVGVAVAGNDAKGAGCEAGIAGFIFDAFASAGGKLNSIAAVSAARSASGRAGCGSAVFGDAPVLFGSEPFVSEPLLTADSILDDGELGLGF